MDYDRRTRVRIPRWVTVTALVVAIVAVVALLMMLVGGGGGHQAPFDHGAGGATPPRQAMSGPVPSPGTHP